MTDTSHRWSPSFSANTSASVRRGLLLFLVASFPLLFLWRYTNDPFNLPKLVLLTAVVAVVAGLRLVEFGLGRRFDRMRSVAMPAALYSIPLLISWLSTDYRSWSLMGQYGRYEGLVPYLIIVVAGLLIADAFDGSKEPLAWAFVIGAWGTAVYALVQALGLDPLDLPTVDGSIASSIGQPNFLGGYLATALPVALSLWMTGGRFRLAAMSSTITLALAILMTFSQGPWAASLAGLALFSAAVSWDRRPRLRLAAFAMAGLIATTMVGSVVYAQITGTVSSTTGTTRARGYWWRSALQMWEDKPLFGHGPNVYAFKNVAYRLPQDALSHPASFTDSPHSVPVAFLANAGALGLLGWLGTAVWGLRRLAARAGPLHAGFAAGAATYLIQSLVSIDQLNLPFAYWVCLGALGALSTASDERKPIPSPIPRRLVLALSVAASVACIAFAGTWSYRAFTADRLAWRASETDRPASAMALFESALDRRDIVWYRTMYGDFLGREAVDQETRGADEIARMRQAFSVVNEIPDARALNAYAFWEHTWSAIDPSARRRAIDLYERSLAIDPHAPFPRILLAEAHLHNGDPESALSTLRHLMELNDRFPVLNSREPDARASVALALIDLGRLVEAERELDRAKSVLASFAVRRSICQIEVADAILTVSRGGETTLLDDTDVRMRLLCSLPMQEIAGRLLDEVRSEHT